MQEERLDRIENVLTQLVKMVGTTNQKLQEMNADMKAIEVNTNQKFEQFDANFNQKLHEIEKKIDNKLYKMENKNEERHSQILEKLNVIKVDQDFIWEKNST
ncbi:MAG: hypothetical protein ABF649_20890 [Bacillus sp. (in: firmicutes)]